VKKLLYTVLIAAMVFGFGTGAFGAAGDIAPPAFSDIAGHEAEGDLTLLGALGVFTGESGLGGVVKPNDSLTRAQFCKVVVTAMGRGSTALGLMGLRPTFSDEVPAWAWGYVNTAMFMGVINGYADGTFGAGNPVKYDETVTMLVRAVAGHKDFVPAGIWPYNFLFYAVDNGFTGGVDVGVPSQPCTRGDMAQMMVATMQVDPFVGRPLEVDEEGAVLEIDGAKANLFEDTLITYAGGTATIGADTETLADPVYLLGGKSANELISNPVMAVANKLGKIVFIERSSGNVVKGVFSKLDHDAADEAKTYIEFADGTTVYYSSTTVPHVVWNGDAGHDRHVNGAGVLLAGDELTINVDKYGKVALVYVLRWDLVNSGVDSPLVYTHGKWDYVSSTVEKTHMHGITEIGTTFAYTADSPYYYNDNAGYEFLAGASFEIPDTALVFLNGVLADRDDILKRDVIKGATAGCEGYLEADDLFAVSAARAVAEGSIVSFRDNTTSSGTTRYVTLQSGDTTKEYAVKSPYPGPLGWEYTPGGLHKYALDEKGKLFWDVAYGVSNPVVLVTGSYVVTHADTVTPTHTYLTVDKGGVSTTYECDEMELPEVGNFVILTISGTTGHATDLENDFGATPTTWYEGVVEAGGDTCTLSWESGYEFVKTAAIYSYSVADEEYTWIGFAGLAVDDELYFDYYLLGTTNVFVIVRIDP